jgi:hypothetical protein
MRFKVLRMWCLAVGAAVLTIAQPWTLLAQAPVPSKVRFAAISETDMREYLGYLASDALQGRQIYTEGYGLAAPMLPNTSGSGASSPWATTGPTSRA